MKAEAISSRIALLADILDLNGAARPVRAMPDAADVTAFVKNKTKLH